MKIEYFKPAKIPLDDVTFDMLYVMLEVTRPKNSPQQA